MPRLLITTVEPSGVGNLSSRLIAEGYQVDIAAHEAARVLLSGMHQYDAILIDGAALGLDPIAAVHRLRHACGSTPILMLSDRSRVADRVKGLDAGVDDYLSMPFSMPELLARVRALLRRHPAPPATILRVGDLELNCVTRHARRGRERIDLSRREFALLELLMQASPGPVRKADILERVWLNQLAPESNAVNVCINAIRRKLHHKARPPLLHTVRGVGFCCRSLN